MSSIRRDRSRAFTLVELLVAMALGTILVGVVGFIFINARQLYDHSLQEIATSNEVRGAFDRLGRDLRDVQASRLDSWELCVIDGESSGPDDALEFVTLDRRGPATPVRVRLRLGARDEDGLAPLTREVLLRADATGTLAAPNPAEPVEVLITRVKSFRVEYAWPAQADAGHVFLRGAGLGPWAGPSAKTGARFRYRNGTGKIVNGTLTISSPPYDGTRLLPRRLARTVHVTTAARPAALPIVDILTSTTLSLAGAPDGDVAFWIPLLPSALQVTVDHVSRNGPRSVTEVLTLTP